MFKNNIIFYTLFALAECVLLFIWFYFGYNTIDSPLDLIIFVIWLVLLIAAIAAIYRTERARRIYLRTAIILGNEFFYFPGFSSVLLPVSHFKDRQVELIKSALNGIDYKKFEVYELEDECNLSPTMVIVSEKYKPNKDIWKGYVIKDDMEIEFNSVEALMILL